MWAGGQRMTAVGIPAKLRKRASAIAQRDRVARSRADMYCLGTGVPRELTKRESCRPIRRAIWFMSTAKRCSSPATASASVRAASLELWTIRAVSASDTVIRSPGRSPIETFLGYASAGTRTYAVRSRKCSRTTIAVMILAQDAGSSRRSADLAQSTAPERPSTTIPLHACTFGRPVTAGSGAGALLAGAGGDVFEAAPQADAPAAAAVARSKSKGSANPRAAHPRTAGRCVTRSFDGGQVTREMKSGISRRAS